MNLEDLPVLRLEGGPRERGLIHGETLKEKIQGVFWGWQYMVEKVTGHELQWAVDRFKAATRFDAAMQTWTPGLLEELEGIAAGAGIPFDHLYMFNCTDENEWFLDRLTNGAEMPEPRGCSSFGVNDATGTLIGQNMDIPGATDGYQVLLHIVEDDQETYLFSLAGMLGMIGLSSRPVGVVNNSLKQLNQRIDGLPVNVVVRGLLMQQDFAAAVRFITSAPHATGHNYIVAGESDVAMFECSANQVTEVKQLPGRVVHTNHPLANDDLQAQTEMNANRSSSNTHDRLTVVTRDVLEADSLNLAALKAALSSHADSDNPVCRHVKDRGTSFSAGALIYEMGSSPTLHMAPGPPCETAFGSWSFNRSG